MSSSPLSVTHVSRRRLLQATGVFLSAAIGLQLASACTPAGPGASTGGANSASGGARLKLPTYAPIASLPAPDLPGTADGLVTPGYLKYPSPLVKSVSQPPGKGGTVN